MKKESLFLLAAALGLVPIALSYGLVPQTSLPFLLDIEVDTVNSTHIYRAVMGLYLANILFWIAGARNESLTIPALWGLTIFMLGLASGRAISLVIDGMPHLLLVTYLILEIGFGFVGYYLVSRLQKA
jgi:hypothetical protein